jgi:HSP20 family protein
MTGDVGMAEPQPNTATEETRAKAGAPGPNGEPRSFDQARGGPARSGAANASADAIAQATQPIAEGGRQIAEQGRRASRQMADAWRQAVDPLLAMQFDMSQWFDDMFRQTFGVRAAPGAHPLRPLAHLSAAHLFGMPPADFRETQAAHLLAIELPGLTRDDVDVSIDGDTLVVCGQKTEESDDASATYRVSERRYGRFERAFPLPPDVDRARIDAQFRDGLLKITLPKTASAAQQRARIDIR